MDLRERLREFTLMLASSITIIGTTAIAAGLPRMSRQFVHVPHDRFLVSLSLTIPALTAGLCAPVMGLIVDRFGRKRLFLIALAAYGASGGAGFLLDNLYAIMISRLVLGMAVSGVATCATVLIADYARRGAIGSLMGRQSLFMALGNVLFVFAGGLLAELGWHWPFLLYLIGLLLIPGVVVLIDDERLRMQAPPAVKGPDCTPAPATRPAALMAMGWVYWLLFLNMVIYFMVPTHLPFYLAQLTGSGSAQSGALLSSVGLCWAISSLCYKHLERRLSHAQILMLTFGMSAVANILLGAADGYMLVIPALALAGVALGLSITNLNTWLFVLAPAGAKGRVIGTRVLFTFIGQFCSPVLTEPFTSRYGFGWSYIAAGCVLAAIVLGTGVQQAVGGARRVETA